MNLRSCVLSVFFIISLSSCSKPGGGSLTAGESGSYPPNTPNPYDTPISGNEIGNGGDAVVCLDSQGHTKSTILLDYYEGEILRFLKPSLGEANTDSEIKVSLVLNRLARLDPERSNRLKSWANVFKSESRFVTDTPLAQTPDYGYVPIPTGCSIKQVALQKSPKFSLDGRYLIDKNLWDQLGEDGRAGLILHEVLYREALARGQSNSISVRYFVALISSEKMASLTSEQYSTLVSETGYDRWQWEGGAKGLWYYFPERRISSFAEAKTFCDGLGVGITIMSCQLVHDVLGGNAISIRANAGTNDESTIWCWHPYRPLYTPSIRDLKKAQSEWIELSGPTQASVLCMRPASNK